jgi:hypothetical protein
VIGGTRAADRRSGQNHSGFVICLSIAIGIALLALPYFNELSNKKLSLAYLCRF